MPLDVWYDDEEKADEDYELDEEKQFSENLTVHRFILNYLLDLSLARDWLGKKTRRIIKLRFR